MILSDAYLFVFHGSRDSRTQAAASKLQQLLIAEYHSKNILARHNYLEVNLPKFDQRSATTSNLSVSPLIEMAALELTSVPLSQKLVNFAEIAHRQRLGQIKVIPLFLAPGVHVTEDIPAEIALATARSNFKLVFKLSPYLGEYSGIVSLLFRRFAELPAANRVLIAHGSRSWRVADYYQSLANKLNADLAYWSTAPRFGELIRGKIAAGIEKMAIVPYFLFPGKITTAIAQEISILRQEYPQVELNLGRPLGATKALAELIVKEA